MRYGISVIPRAGNAEPACNRMFQLFEQFINRFNDICARMVNDPEKQ